MTCEAVRINSTHLFEGRDRKKEEQLSNCQRSSLIAVNKGRGRKADRVLEPISTVEWSVDKEPKVVSRRYTIGLKLADRFDEELRRK